MAKYDFFGGLASFYGNICKYLIYRYTAECLISKYMKKGSLRGKEKNLNHHFKII